MADVQSFTSANFESEVLKASGPVLVDFTATWCQPCQRLAPVIDEVAKEFLPKGVKVGKVDVDENQDLAARYGVMSVPTLLFFKGGQVKDQASFSPKAKIAEKLNKVLEG